MIPAFQTKKISGSFVMTEEEKLRLSEYKASLADDEYTLVLMKKPTWNTDQMRKYLHGPVFKFILGEMRKGGYVTTKAQIKKDFKEMFGPREDVKTLLGVKSEPISTSLYSKDQYNSIITRIDDWCKDKLKVSIPSKEQVAIAENKD